MLLEQMPSNATVAEIGVFKGDFSELILSKTSPKKYYLIDIWGSERYNDHHFLTVNDKFSKEISNGQVEIVRALSFDGIALLADASLDWVT